jgi:hypothetical protein
MSEDGCLIRSNFEKGPKGECDLLLFLDLGAHDIIISESARSLNLEGISPERGDLLFLRYRIRFSIFSSFF